MKAQTAVIHATLLAWSFIPACWGATEGIVPNLTVKKPQLLVGEPLWISTVLSNSGAADAPFIIDGSYVADILIARPNQGFELYDSSTLIRADGKPLTGTTTPVQGILAAGITYSRANQILVFADAPAGKPATVKYAFPFANVFSVKARLGKSESQPLQITVSDPTGDDFKMWSLLSKDDSYAKLLQWRVVSHDSLSNLTAIVTGHPKSIYSQYLALALAKYYWSHGQDSNLELVRKYYQTTVSMTQVRFLREQAYLRWAEMLRGSPEAIDVCNQALAAFPNSQYKDRFQKLRQSAIDIANMGANDPQ